MTNNSLAFFLELGYTLCRLSCCSHRGVRAGKFLLFPTYSLLGQQLISAESIQDDEASVPSLGSMDGDHADETAIK